MVKCARCGKRITITEDWGLYTRCGEDVPLYICKKCDKIMFEDIKQHRHGVRALKEIGKYFVNIKL